MTKEEKELYLSERLAKIVIHSGCLGNEFLACKDIFENKKLKDIVRRGVQCHQRLAEELRQFSRSTPELSQLMEFAQGEPSYLLSEILDECTGMPEGFLKDILLIAKEHKAGKVTFAEAED